MGNIDIVAREAPRRNMEVEGRSKLGPTIFHEAWWLTAATAGRYEQAEVYSGGRMVGCFPYMIERLSLGRTLCRQPPLTYLLGPAIDEGEGSHCNRALRRDQIALELLRKLPRTTAVSHRMHHGWSDLVVFQEQGFGVSAEFSREIRPMRPADAWRAMRDKTRNVIRGASGVLEVQDSGDPEWLAHFYLKNTVEAGYKNLLDLSSLSRLCAASRNQNRGRILAALKHDGQAEAAIFYVWDAERAYYIATTRDRRAHNGAVSLLLWTAIQDCCGRGLTFDFGGIGTRGARLFYTGFGGWALPSYTVSRFSKYHRSIDLVRRSLSRPPKSKYL